jgi:hypothetical protein
VGERVSAPTSVQRRRRSLTKRDCKLFLEALAAGWSVRHAAERAGRTFARFYELREADEDFAAQWAEAFEQGTQRLEDEATRRAVEGYDEETYDGEDKLIRRVRRYDSALLQQQLKRRRPEAYRESVPLATQPIAIVLQEVRLEPSGGRREVVEGEATEHVDELPRGES